VIIMLTRIWLFAFSIFLAHLSFADLKAEAIDTVLLGNAEIGKNKSETCAACHNQDGNSINPIWPKLAGQHVIYLVKQMQEFKQGEKGPRHNVTMTPLMQTLTEEDMINIATYFSEQKV